MTVSCLLSLLKMIMTSNTFFCGQLSLLTQLSIYSECQQGHLWFYLIIKLSFVILKEMVRCTLGWIKTVVPGSSSVSCQQLLPDKQQRSEASGGVWCSGVPWNKHCLQSNRSAKKKKSWSILCSSHSGASFWISSAGGWWRGTESSWFILQHLHQLQTWCSSEEQSVWWHHQDWRPSSWLQDAGEHHCQVW